MDSTSTLQIAKMGPEASRGLALFSIYTGERQNHEIQVGLWGGFVALSVLYRMPEWFPISR
jgi:hypothetical protein